MADSNGKDEPAIDATGMTMGVLAGPETSSLGGLFPGPALFGGRYEILGMLGEGGMGTVYRARDVELDELVALKMLRHELSDAPGILARFRQEAKLARRVTHRNVARTFDIGEHEGAKFLTMELVDGESLASLAARRGRLSITEVASLVDQIAQGMAAAHDASVIHRDLKPDNVLIATDGRVLVTDFGIAHAAAGVVGAAKTVGGIVGTPAYMAPEQVEAATDIDARADLYALGAIIYELLTGEVPWPGDAPLVVAVARLLGPPPDPRAINANIPDAVADVVLRCMARSRDDRFASAAELSAAFTHAVSAAGVAGARVARTGADVTAPIAPARAAVPASPHTLGLDKTIVVLPFKNGGLPEDEYLAEGMTDDLIDMLSMTSGLKVRPRGASAHLRGVDVDARRVGEELKVQVVVEGAVRKIAASIRVTARLVSTADGFQLWAKRFDRAAADVLAVNDEVASAIADALAVVGAQKPRVAPTNVEAVDLYFRASHEYHKFWREDVLRAVDLYEQALALAPNDATILAACARARVRAAFFGGEGAAEMLGKAHAAADRAVAGAPEMGESWLALAAARMMEGDAAGAARAVVTALERSKGLAPAHELMGRILVEAVGPAEAVVHFRRALAIDPAEVTTRFELAKALALLGQWDEATALLDVPATTPSGRTTRFLWGIRQCIWRGELHPDLARPPELGAGIGVTAGHAHAMIGVLTNRELTETVRKELEDRVIEPNLGLRRRTFFLQLNAEIYAFVFEVDHALKSLAAAIDAGLMDLVWMDRCPILEPVRQDPRFVPLRAEVAARAQPVVIALGRA